MQKEATHTLPDDLKHSETKSRKVKGAKCMLTTVAYYSPPQNS